jgi:tetratricopeptide (TPR) repeat protein
MLLPVSHILPFLAIKAERFLYVPSIFYCVILSLPLIIVDPKKRYFKYVLITFSILILFYGYISYDYSKHFKSEITIWQEMTKRSPQNSKAHFNLALCMMDKNQKDIAISHFKKVVDIEKKNTKDYSSLGVSYFMLGKNKEAKETFLEGMNNDPNKLILIQNFAVFNYYTGDLNSALDYINQALKISPNNQSSIRIKQMISKKLLNKKSQQ